MREREQLKIVNDLIGTPTWALSVAGAVWGLIESGTLRRIYHWADLGVASWYDFAVAIQEEALLRGLLLRPAAIAPISTDAYPSRAVRPRFSVLDTSETRELLRIPGLHWREALRRMLDELAA
jgi:dTDP-4-dehydrorhamnose reductase